MPTVDVRLLPSLIAPGSLAGRVAVVVDQLRATSTIARALAEGAERVIPCVEVEEARSLAERLRGSGRRVLTGGERAGVRIEGFDLDNSPEAYTRDRVGGSTIVFTTTNGTAAMRAAAQARASRVLACSLANLSATARACAQAPGTPEDVCIVCAGTRGEISQDDAVVAGALASLLAGPIHGFEPASDDAVRIAMSLHAAAATRPDGIYEQLAESRGGRNLRRIGLEADIRWCAQPDRYGFAVQLNLQSWELTRSDV